jgi:hypothetical protein
VGAVLQFYRSNFQAVINIMLSSANSLKRARAQELLSVDAMMDKIQTLDISYIYIYIYILIKEARASARTVD